MTDTHTHKVEVGIGGPMGPPAKMLTARPQSAEEKGYASMWWGDHYMGWVPRSIWTPDISPVAQPGTNPDVLFDSVACMAVAGAATSKISIGVTTEAVRRHPMALAQQFQTLQHITKGRTILGLGGGEGENIVPYGLTFEKPVGRMEEAIQVVKLLWDTDGPVAFAGDHFKFDDAVLGMHAPDSKNPEIWVCGVGPRMCRIAGQLCDGWLPTMLTAEEYGEKVSRIQKARAGAGRGDDPFTFGMFTFAVIAESLEAAQPLLEHPFVKGMLLTLPAHAFERFGASHPLGDGASGMLEYIPGRVGREEALSMISSIPDELVREYVLHGSPDDVRRQLEPFAAAGLEHICILNVAPLADPASARQSFALMDDMATGLQFEFESTVQGV